MGNSLNPYCTSSILFTSRQSPISTPNITSTLTCCVLSRLTTYADSALIATHPSGPKGANMFVRYTCVVAVGAIPTRYCQLPTSNSWEERMHVPALPITNTNCRILSVSGTQLVFLVRPVVQAMPMIGPAWTGVSYIYFG